GSFKLLNTLTTTNGLGEHGEIYGWIDLGNSPRTFHAPMGNGWMNVYARIAGGPAATLNKVGENKMTFFGANTYQGLTDIQLGSIEVCHPNALGTTANGTVVHDGASIAMSSATPGLPSITVANETLTIAGFGISEINGAFASFGTNIWDGLVILQN